MRALTYGGKFKKLLVMLSIHENKKTTVKELIEANQVLRKG